MEGVYNNENLRIAFGKTYKLGTGNPHENKGHTVEYRGMRNQNAAQVPIAGAQDTSKLRYRQWGDRDTDIGEMHDS